MKKSVISGGRLIVCVAGLVGTTAIACSQPQKATTPALAVGGSHSTGRVRGLVTLRGSVPPARSEPIAKDQNICGPAASVTRIALGKDNGVRHAFIYLDDVPVQEEPRPRLSTRVEQTGCEYGPRVAAVSTGAQIEIVNNDPILHNVHAREATPDGLQTVFNIAQPVRGQRTKVDAPLNKPGIITLTCEAGHPWMNAYILVAGHPYVATTNNDGEFIIDGVPPGTYPIKMWHEGVRLTRVIPSLQQFEYEDPYETTQQVVVQPNGDAVVNFALEMRPAE